jgi:hypothetical protein
VTYLKSLVFLLALGNAVYFLWARGIATPQNSFVEASSAKTLKLVSESPGPVAAAASGTGSGAANVGANVAASDDAAKAAAASAAIIAAQTPPPGPPPALLHDVKRCITVGPFPDVAEAAHAAATLRSGGYEPRQRVTEGEVWAGVWVYLPLPSTAAATEQIHAKLKAGGIDDALEMPGPNDKPVISLGLFSEPRRAQLRVTQAQALGLNPGVADRTRAGDVYWVNIDLKPTDSLLNPADLQSESGRIVRLEVKACPVPEGPAS